MNNKKFTHEDWEKYKEERRLQNKHLAEILGMSVGSVTNQTQKAKKLPRWAIAMLWEWKEK